MQKENRVKNSFQISENEISEIIMSLTGNMTKILDAKLFVEKNLGAKIGLRYSRNLGLCKCW